MGMQDYLYQSQNKNLNDTWELSSSILTYDKDILLDTIMLKAATLGVNYTNPDQYYAMCRMWWRKWIPTFQEWWHVAETEYHWEWNTEWSENGTDSGTETGTLGTVTSDREVIDTDTTGREITDEDTTVSLTGLEVVDDNTTYSKSGQNSSTTTNQVSAYDASTYQPESQQSMSGSNSESGSGTDDKTINTTEATTGALDRTLNSTGTVDTTRNTTGSVDTDTSKDTTGEYSKYKKGNIGVMTTQSLAQEEYLFRFQYNPYELMSAVFVKEMTCAVW